MYKHKGAQPTTDISTWADQFKEQMLEINHDDARFDFVSADDSLLVAGPARLYDAANPGSLIPGAQEDKGPNAIFYVIGSCQNVQITETSQIQPLKAIGSRRHLFTKTNTPAQVSMARMMFFGPNLARALYGSTALKPMAEDASSGYNQANNKYAQGYDTLDKSKFLTNLEEDLYRTPIGIGIIYHTPRTAGSAKTKTGLAVGAEYLECCYLQSRQVSIQAQQTVVMEQVQLVADRVVPWDAYYQYS